MHTFYSQQRFSQTRVVYGKRRV